MVTEFIKDLIDDVGDVLEVRDEIGVIKSWVYIVTRTWSGRRVGEGDAREFKVQILPTPWLVEIAHDVRIQEGGAVQQGDILVKHLSKKEYPIEEDINCHSGDKQVEKFYEINGLLYNVISVKNDYAYWNVQVRKLSDQTRYE